MKPSIRNRYFLHESDEEIEIERILLKGKDLISEMKRQMKSNEPNVKKWFNSPVIVEIETDESETDSWKNYKSDFDVSYEYNSDDNQEKILLTVSGKLGNVISFLERAIKISNDEGLDFGKSLASRKTNWKSLGIKNNSEKSDFSSLFIDCLPKVVSGIASVD